MILIFKPWYQEEYKNERRKLGKYVFTKKLEFFGTLNLHDIVYYHIFKMFVAFSFLF